MEFLSGRTNSWAAPPSACSLLAFCRVSPAAQTSMASRIASQREGASGPVRVAEQRKSFSRCCPGHGVRSL
eukprot:9466689-Pyramimonas_sp.AAC.1